MAITPNGTLQDQGTGSGQYAQRRDAHCLVGNFRPQSAFLRNDRAGDLAGRGERQERPGRLLRHLSLHRVYVRNAQGKWKVSEL